MGIPARRILLLTMVFSLLSCGASLSAYKKQQPEMDLFGYFEGKTKAWGMVQDYSGKQIRRFEAEIIGTVTGNELRLDEYFIYDDGEQETRIWVITKMPDGQYIASATDVIGQAIGTEQGNALNWRYTLQVQTQRGPIHLQVNDWFFRQDEKHVFNKTSMRKLGVELASTTLFFQKIDD